MESLGHSCSTAPDGVRAWDLVREQRPDVLVTDLSMPGMDGLELCRMVRQDAVGYTYVVLLTSHDAPEDVLAGMRAGADDYLTKPLDPVALAARLLAARRVTELHADLAAARNELTRQAHTDPLTGLFNRLSLTADLDALERTNARYGGSYAVAMCDVDLFKHYNDRYGHQAGDEALRIVATTFVEQLRDVDRVYRYGGEEFLVLLPEQTVDAAALAMERVRARLEVAAVEHRGGGPSGVLTISVGNAGSVPGQSERPRALLAAADAALYEAKARGRNAVAVAPAVGAGSTTVDFVPA